MAMPHGSLPHLGLILHRGRDTLFHAFIQAMAMQGFVDGQTIHYEARFAEGVLSRTRELAKDLVHREVDMIVAIGAVGAAAARQATTTIPIVFAIVLDPVDLGFAASYDHPMGNMAGVTNYDPDLPLQQLSLLRQVVPSVTKVAVFSDADIPRPASGNPLEQSCARAADMLGITLEWFRPSGPTPDRAGMIREAVARGCGAALALEVPSNIAAFGSLAALTTAYRLPAMFPDGWQHDGLMSYGTSLLHTVPQLPEIIRCLLSGTPPGDVPVRLIRAHRLTLNLATARRIGIELPPELVARAAKLVA